MSTSGGSKGALRLARVVLDGAELGTLGTSPVAVPLVGAPGEMFVATHYVEQYDDIDSNFDFSGAHLLLCDDSGATLLDPTVQTFASAVMSAQHVDTSIRLTAQQTNPAFLLQTAGNVDPVVTAPVATFAVAVGGTGYAQGDTGTVDGGGNDCAYHVVTVGALGVVTAIALDAGGSNYDTTNNPRTTTNGGAQPGVGVGLTVNITAITAGASTLTVAVAYLTVRPS